MENSTPEISIIIPTYNGERFLAATLDSVLAQTVTDWECIVVDDGSRDGSGAIVERFTAQDGRIRLVKQANGGIAHARNRGLAEIGSRSKYVCFLDHDDVWESDALETLRAALEANPNAAAAHGIARYLGSDGKPNFPGELEKKGKIRYIAKNRRLFPISDKAPTSFATLILWNPMCTAGLVLVRRSILQAAGGFDPKAVPADDWDMWIRLSRRSDLIFVDKVVLGWRKHDWNTSNDDRRMAGAVRYVIQKTYLSTENTEEQRRILWNSWKALQLGMWRFKAEMVRSDLQRGRMVPAAKQLVYGIRHLARYVRGVPFRAPEQG